MQLIEIRIGRNIGDTPMTNKDWDRFQADAVAALKANNKPSVDGKEARRTIEHIRAIYKPALADGKKVFAGHPTSVQVPPDTRIKSLALLGGGRPGYEFHPTLGNDTTYTTDNTPYNNGGSTDTDINGDCGFDNNHTTTNHTHS